MPSSSSTFWGLSPARTRWLKVSHLSAICLPQVKHRTGMIILTLLPVRFLFTSSSAGTPEFLRFCQSLVACDHDTVERHETLAQFTTLRPSGQATRDCDTGRFCLSHYSSSLRGYSDVDLF